MTAFFIRLFIFSFLWVWMMTHTSENVSISIMFFAVSLGLYFFLSMQNISFFIYVALLVVIGVHGVLAGESVLTMLLCISVLVPAVFQLQEHKFVMLTSFVIVLIVVIRMILEESVLVPLFLLLFFAFLAMTVKNKITENREQKAMYEQLVSEYKQLKRTSLSSEQQARIEERTRIARDIHDSVGHRLTALMMRLEMLAIQKNDPTFREVKRMAEECLEDTREAVKALQLSETEGIATVVQLIRKLEAESHLLIHFTLKDGVLSLPLSNEKNVVLYRVIQEALTNAMRHAQTREVQVTLGKSPIGDLAFQISNSYIPTKSFQFGFGLTNMKERVEALNGRLDVYQTDRHFIVKGMIPVES